MHDANDLIRLFEHEFAAEFRTRLVAGGDEPLYRPAMDDEGWNEIVFRHDYFRSALHEVAHWCVAGAARRRQVDYGYWYDPDGRTAARQSEFESVEARPQAVEWMLSVACGVDFRVSMDNLGCSEPLDEGSLWHAVHHEVARMLDEASLPPRAKRFASVLAAHYGRPWPLNANQFFVPGG